MEHNFTLTYQLHPDDSNHDSIIERLHECGCNDALVGLGVEGHIALEFIREGATAASAIESAKADVARAIPTATFNQRK
jgi:hypothetical protein